MTGVPIGADQDPSPNEFYCAFAMRCGLLRWGPSWVLIHKLVKLEALSDALALALKRRNVSDLQATLAARAGLAAFAHATISWLENEEPGLAERLNLA